MATMRHQDAEERTTSPAASVRETVKGPKVWYCGDNREDTMLGYCVRIPANVPWPGADDELDVELTAIVRPGGSVDWRACRVDGDDGRALDVGHVLYAVELCDPAYLDSLERLAEQAAHDEYIAQRDQYYDALRKERIEGSLS